MSPEQITADPAIDQRADIYALGVVAYEMFAGQPPFTGPTAQALIAAHVIDTPEPLTKRRPAVPAALAALVMRCLEKRPADRPQSAQEVMQALDAMTTPTQTLVPHPLRTRRLSRTATIAIALVAVAAAGGAWLKFGPKRAGSAGNSRLLIAPFENLTGDDRFDHIGLVAADRIGTMVAQAGTVDVVPPNMVVLSLRDTSGGQLERLKRLSEATNAGQLVLGSIILRGDSLTLQARVTEVRSGKTVITLVPVSSATQSPPWMRWLIVCLGHSECANSGFCRRTTGRRNTRRIRSGRRGSSASQCTATIRAPGHSSSKQSPSTPTTPAPICFSGDSISMPESTIARIRWRVASNDFRSG
jgi:TolB-like protein